jgi:hypothetical protein
MELERLVEVWKYAGRRLTGKGLVQHVWQTPDGEFTYWGTTLKGRVIGGNYEITVNRDSGKARVWSGTLNYVGRSDDPATSQWELADMDCENRRAALLLEKRDAKDGEFTRAIAPLLALIRPTTPYAERHAMIAAVSREVMNR